MQPTPFLCSLPDYKPSRAAKQAYKKIDDVLKGTHKIAGLLAFGAMYNMLAGREPHGIIFPDGAIKFLTNGQTAETITAYDFNMLTDSFKSLNKIQRAMIEKIVFKAMEYQQITDDDHKILRCIYSSVR